MSYRDQLRTVWRQRRRDEIRIRANYRCEICSRADQFLNVHHVHYIGGRKPWEYPDELLVCLCDECHGEWHEEYQKTINALAVILKRVPAKRIAKVAQHVMGQALEHLE